MSDEQYPYEAGRRDVEMTNIPAYAYSDADFNRFNYSVCFVMYCFKGGIFVPALWVDGHCSSLVRGCQQYILQQTSRVYGGAETIYRVKLGVY